MARGRAPTLRIEREAWGSGHGFVVGMDEVGRGAWAGPVSVGAAVLPTGRRVNGVRDSKLLDEAERERLFPRIADWCVAWSVGHADNDECDELGMSAALALAAARALDALGLRPDLVLLDGPFDFLSTHDAHRGVPVRPVVGGDAACLSIATASILAKVTRDRMMRDLAPACPAFAFETNKGYPAPVHRAALRTHGPTRWHRRSWAFMDDLPGHERYVRPEPGGAGADQPSLFAPDWS